MSRRRHEHGWTIARVGGVPVRLRASHLALAGVLGVAFYGISAASTLPGVVAAGAVIATGASLLVHELAHGMVARRCGVTVAEYGLGLTGAYTRTAGAFPTARAAAWTMAAGPAASLLLAVALIVATTIAMAAGAPSPVVDVVLLAAVVNLTAAIANVIPIRPLDGGRLLEVVLLARLGDAGRAARASAWVGGSLAVVVIGLGVWPALDGGAALPFTVLGGMGLLALNVGGQVTRAGLSVAVAGAQGPPPR